MRSDTSRRGVNTRTGRTGLSAPRTSGRSLRAHVHWAIAYGAMNDCMTTTARRAVPRLRLRRDADNLIARQAQNIHRLFGQSLRNFRVQDPSGPGAGSRSRHDPSERPLPSAGRAMGARSRSRFRNLLCQVRSPGEILGGRLWAGPLEFVPPQQEVVDLACAHASPPGLLSPSRKFLRTGIETPSRPLPARRTD